MRVRVLDLDGSITSQDRLLSKFRPEVLDLLRWGPSLRTACRWAHFHRFERWLDRVLDRQEFDQTWINFLGSGDFHHLSLALLRRLHQPVNLLVLDKHPSWLRGAPFLHSGSWMYHAARLPNIHRIFHVGGDANFDNGWRWLAPRRLLESGKIVVLPALRHFHGGCWSAITHDPIRANAEAPVNRERLEELLWPHLQELESRPLYVSLDKDVMWMPEAVVNGESGYLDLLEVQELLDFFMKLAGNELAGMDIAGDWSPVRTRGLLRKLLQRGKAIPHDVDANQARLCNERTNTFLLQFLMQDPTHSRAREASAYAEDI